MPNATISKTSATTKGDAHQITNNYSTSCTRSASKSHASDPLVEEGIKFEIWEIDPERARYILANMAENRNIKKTRVTRYASDMENGRWFTSPQPIIFDKNLQLVDGQHRLSAVIKSGTSQKFIVAFNVPKETPIDVGLPRSTGDSLRCRGMISHAMGQNNSVAMVNLFFRLKYGSREKFRATTDDDKAIFLNKYEDTILLSQSICYKGSNHPICKKAGVHLAVFFALLSGVNQDVLYKFAEIANTGYYDKDCQRSAVAFRNSLMDIKASGEKDMIAIESIAEQAIHDFVKGVPRTRKYHAADKFPYSGNYSVEEVLTE